jgi:hypothetical protein
MLDINAYLKQSEAFSPLDRIVATFGPQLYLAENIADYKKSMLKLKSGFLNNSHYALISIYNVGIDAVFENEERVRNMVHVHDASGIKVMSWNEPGEDLPAAQSYDQLLEEGILKPKDFVYRLLFSHWYPSQGGPLSCVAEIKKQRFSNHVHKPSLADRLEALFPDLPILNPERCN